MSNSITTASSDVQKYELFLALFGLDVEA